MLLLTTALALRVCRAQLRRSSRPPADPQNQQTDPQEQKADAKEPPTPPHTGIRALFGDLGEDIKHLPEMQNVYIAAIGGGLAPWPCIPATRRSTPSC